MVTASYHTNINSVTFIRIRKVENRNNEWLLSHIIQTSIQLLPFQSEKSKIETVKVYFLILYKHQFSHFHSNQKIRKSKQWMVTFSYYTNINSVTSIRIRKFENRNSEWLRPHIIQTSIQSPSFQSKNQKSKQ